MKSVLKILKTIDAINISVGRAASFLLILISGIIVYEIVIRSFFGKPTEWAHEVSGMMFGALFMFGAGYVLYKRAHVRVDIIVSHFHPRIQALIDIITHVLLVIYGVVVIKFGWDYAVRAFIRMEVTDSSWAPVTFPIKFVLIFGVALLMLQLLAKYIRDFYIVITGKELR